MNPFALSLSKGRICGSFGGPSTGSGRTGVTSRGRAGVDEPGRAGAGGAAPAGVKSPGLMGSGRHGGMGRQAADERGQGNFAELVLLRWAADVVTVARWREVGCRRFQDHELDGVIENYSYL